MLSEMSTQQIAVRLPEDVLEQVDSLVERGEFATRTDAVRRGLELLLAMDERERIDAAIIAGYTAHPVTDEEMAWAWKSVRESIAEEPW